MNRCRGFVKCDHIKMARVNHLKQVGVEALAGGFSHEFNSVPPHRLKPPLQPVPLVYRYDCNATKIFNQLYKSLGIGCSSQLLYYT